jgi:hypothetical protein
MIMTILYSIFALMFFSVVAIIVLPVLVAISFVGVAGLVASLTQWKMAIAPAPAFRASERGDLAISSPSANFADDRVRSPLFS